MASVLITQTGNPHKTQSGGYIKTDYPYRGITFSAEITSIGLAKHFAYDKILMLGTSGSAWEGLYGVFDDDTVLEAMETLENKSLSDEVKTDDLHNLNEYLSAQFDCEVCCEVTPFIEMHAIEESIEHLQIIASHLSEGDVVTIDVTHGLRFHPMLCIVVAQYLSNIQKITIDDIVYGNFMRKQNGIAPVQSLTGMLNILDWIDALNSFDKDGDYGVFAELMKRDNVSEDDIKRLQSASFNERITSTKHAFDSADSPLSTFF